jgi:transcriptional regulator with XRE-family HTH domain
MSIAYVGDFYVGTNYNEDMDTLGQRIRFARKTAKLMQHEVASHFAIDRVNISQWESDTTKPDIEKFPELANLLKTSIGWLIDGRGLPPIPSAPKNKTNMISSYDPDVDDRNANAYSREHWVPTIEGALPELDVKLGAGEGIVGEIISLPLGDERISGHRVVAEWLVPENYLTHEAKASGQNTIVMEVIGDSMHPSYMPGDRVLVDLLQNKMVTDTVYAISDGEGEPQIKRLQRVPFSKPVQVKIISDNPALETFTVDLHQLHIIGRVCGHIARR